MSPLNLPSAGTCHLVLPLLRSNLRRRHLKVWQDLAADRVRAAQQRRQTLLDCGPEKDLPCSRDSAKDPGLTGQDLPEVFAGPDGMCLKARAYLGSGAYGSVYRAEDEAGRTFALKIGKEHLLQDLSHEARLLSSFHHPGVVSSFGLTSTTCNQVALKLQCGQMNLGRYLDEHASTSRSSRVSWQMTAQLLSALLYIHEKKVVHADVKPGNTLVFMHADNGSAQSCPRLKLCDFGLSVELGPEGHATVVGREVYTLPYRPFECAMADTRRVRIGPGCDVFAMGALSFRVFAARVLFSAEIYESLLKDPSPQAQRSLSGRPPVFFWQCAAIAWLREEAPAESQRKLGPLPNESPSHPSPSEVSPSRWHPARSQSSLATGFCGLSG